MSRPRSDRAIPLARIRCHCGTTTTLYDDPPYVGADLTTDCGHAVGAWVNDLTIPQLPVVRGLTPLRLFGSEYEVRRADDGRLVTTRIGSARAKETA